MADARNRGSTTRDPAGDQEIAVEREVDTTDRSATATRDRADHRPREDRAAGDPARDRYRHAPDPRYEETGFRLSWGAIIAGLVIATVLQLLFMLGGAALGLAAWSPETTAEGAGMAAGIWIAISSLVALFIGGMTAGRLAGFLTPDDGAIHGVLVWGTSMIVTVWLAASGVGAVLGGTLNLAGSPLAADIVQQTGMEQVAEDAEQTAQQQAAQADAEEAADATARGAGWALLAMGLGVAAAAGGAVLTSRE